MSSSPKLLSKYARLLPVLALSILLMIFKGDSK